jgi:hypothetical protein
LIINKLAVNKNFVKGSYIFLNRIISRKRNLYPCFIGKILEECIPDDRSVAAEGSDTTMLTWNTNAGATILNPQILVTALFSRLK